MSGEISIVAELGVDVWEAREECFVIAAVQTCQERLQLWLNSDDRYNLRVGDDILSKLSSGQCDDTYNDCIKYKLVVVAKL